MNRSVLNDTDDIVTALSSPLSYTARTRTLPIRIRGYRTFKGSVGVIMSVMVVLDDYIWMLRNGIELQ